MWIYNKKDGRCFNTDTTDLLYTEDEVLYVAFNSSNTRHIINTYTNADYANSELNRIVSAISENKKVYVIE